VAVADGDRVAADLGQDLDARPVLLDPRRPDEDRPQRLLPETLDPEVLLEALQLPAEGVAAADVVRQPEMVAVADDHPGAAAEDRAARLVEGRDRLVQALALHPHRDGGRLPAGDHQPVETDELIRGADLAGRRAERFQHSAVSL